jgi:opacity protein-like surface antigen
MNIGLEWSPLKRLTVDLGYQYSMRNSNEDDLKFDDHTVMTRVRYKF